MFRTLDLDQVTRLAEQRGLTPAALLRRAGLTAQTTPPVPSALTLAQLLHLAEALEVSVDELLTTPATEPQSLAHDVTTREIVMLATSLLRHRHLPEHAVQSAFAWSQHHLNQVIARLHQHMEPLGITVRRHADRLTLSVLPRTTAQQAETALAPRLADEPVLDPEQIPMLLTAVRAHMLGPYPGPPLVAWQLADDLAALGAACPPEAHLHGKPVRLRPHPDLLYALHLTHRPSTQSPDS
ncbi:hypothetical protein [Nonomuraea typhae]|uniref:XRE family transcriptional regulator n=1 Tax=Nonomuraea typhae TaxID=2603600 RepID=A0ABW7Z6R9_9ACTN